jgi:protein subunit release factor A
MRSFTAKDFEIEWFSGTGSGGQHRNKHQNCCRIKHKESGLSAVGQNSRSRIENQRIAFKTLAQKLVAFYSLEENEDDDYSENHESTVVRTYNFDRSVAYDGDVSQPIKSTIDGDLDSFLINSLRSKTKRNKTGRM